MCFKTSYLERLVIYDSRSIGVLAGVLAGVLDGVLAGVFAVEFIYI